MNEIQDLKDLKRYEEFVMRELAKGAKFGYTDMVRTMQFYYIPNENKTIMCRIISEDGTEYYHGKQATRMLMQNRNFRKTIKDYTMAAKRNVPNAEYFPAYEEKEADSEVIEANSISVAGRVEKQMESGRNFEDAWGDVSFDLKEEIESCALDAIRKEVELRGLRSLVNNPSEDVVINVSNNKEQNKTREDR